MNPHALLTFADLSFARDYQDLFAHLAGQLAPGELLQVQGANGSGKSTLLRIFAGLIEPCAGQLFWDNKNIEQQREHYQQQLHYLGHANGSKSGLTVYENALLLNHLLGNKASLALIKKSLAELALYS